METCNGCGKPINECSCVSTEIEDENFFELHFSKHTTIEETADGKLENVSYYINSPGGWSPKEFTMVMGTLENIFK
jgi:hypothetical protein